MNATPAICGRLEARLREARARLEAATGYAERANVGADRVTPGLLADGTHDSAVLSGTRRKPNRKLDDRRWNAYSRAAQAQVNLDRLRNDVRVLEIQLDKAIKERDRVAFTAADLAGATLVRNEYGWHRVAKVNRKTVAVKTGYSWNDLIPVEKVLQFHAADPASIHLEDIK